LPYWVTVTTDKEGNFLVAVPNVMYVTKYAKIKEEGEEREVYYYEPVVNEFVHTFEGNEVKAFSVQGEPIDRKDFEKLLARKTLFLASTDGRKVPPFYLRIIKEDTVVLAFSRTLCTPYSPPSAEPQFPPGKEPKDWKSKDCPKGPAPYWVNLSIDKEGKFHVGVPTVTYKSGTAKIKKNGEEIEAYYFKPVATENVKQFDRGDVHIFGVDGKAVDSKAVQNLLRGEKKILVLASTDGRKVDPFYLRIIKEGTLVLVLSKPLWDTSVPPAQGFTPPP
jgi:hypothetical protein